jgi:hypothetical protein
LRSDLSLPRRSFLPPCGLCFVNFALQYWCGCGCFVSLARAWEGETGKLEKNVIESKKRCGLPGNQRWSLLSRTSLALPLSFRACVLILCWWERPHALMGRCECQVRPTCWVLPAHVTLVLDLSRRSPRAPGQARFKTHRLSSASVSPKVSSCVLKGLSIRSSHIFQPRSSEIADPICPSFALW